MLQKPYKVLELGCVIAKLVLEAFFGLKPFSSFSTIRIAEIGVCHVLTPREAQECNPASLPSSQFTLRPSCHSCFLLQSLFDSNIFVVVLAPDSFSSKKLIIKCCLQASVLLL